MVRGALCHGSLASARGGRHLAGRNALLWLLVPIVLAAAPTASANETTYVVQNRLYQMRHEIAIFTGILPLDAFYKGMTLGGGYTWHISEAFAWEVARFAYSFNMQTDLAEELKANFGVQPTAYDRIRYFMTTSFVFKPLFGKWSLLNRTVVRDEFFLTVNVGMLKLVNTPADHFQATFGGGLGLRVFFTNWLSLRLEVRDFAYFDGAAGNNVMELSLGPSLNL